VLTAGRVAKVAFDKAGIPAQVLYHNHANYVRLLNVENAIVSTLMLALRSWAGLFSVVLLRQDAQFCSPVHRKAAEVPDRLACRVLSAAYHLDRPLL